MKKALSQSSLKGLRFIQTKVAELNWSLKKAIGSLKKAIATQTPTCTSKKNASSLVQLNSLGQVWCMYDYIKNLMKC